MTLIKRKPNERYASVNENAMARLGDTNKIIDVVNTLEGIDVGEPTELVPVTRTNNPTSASSTIFANLDKLDAAIGADAVSFAIISNAASVTANLSSLDLAVYFLQNAATFNATTASLSALGTNQATAAPVVAGISVVNLADGTVGVVLPVVGTTKVIYLYNTVANNDLNVYPATGEYLNAAAQNASIKFKHATDTSVVVCTYQAATKWTVTAIHGTIS